MAGAADSEDYLQYDNAFLDPGQDLELEPMGRSFTPGTEKIGFSVSPLIGQEPCIERWTSHFLTACRPQTHCLYTRRLATLASLACLKTPSI